MTEGERTSGPPIWGPPKGVGGAGTGDMNNEQTVNKRANFCPPGVCPFDRQLSCLSNQMSNLRFLFPSLYLSPRMIFAPSKRFSKYCPQEGDFSVNLSRFFHCWPQHYLICHSHLPRSIIAERMEDDDYSFMSLLRPVFHPVHFVKQQKPGTIDLLTTR